MFKPEILICMAILAFSATAAASVRINPSLVQTIARSGTANIIVRMSSGTSQITQKIAQSKFSDRGERLTSLTAALQSHAKESQHSVHQLLQKTEIGYKSLWISNEIYIPNANNEIINQLAQLDGIAEIREEIVVSLESNFKNLAKSDNSKQSPVPSALEPNIIQIEAYRAWEELGISGENAIIASIDTGVRSTHISLRGNFVGDYGWFDPPLGSLVPDDFVGQGTHSMGVMVGKYGIGVAPEAKWMACRGCDFSCQESSLTACAQWVLCPTLANGTVPNCTKAPHVVNNAWWTLGGNNFFDLQITAWKAGGIVPIFTAGNDGPDCYSIRSPADSLVGVIAVSSNTEADTISVRSSQGPSFFNQIKPDIVAPGESIISASNLQDTGFIRLMGAGSGSAHIAGTIGLLKSADMNLGYTGVTGLLYNNTDQSTGTSGMDCGGVDDETEFPNNSIGWGRVNAYRAVRAALMKQKNTN